MFNKGSIQVSLKGQSVVEVRKGAMRFERQIVSSRGEEEVSNQAEERNSKR